VVALIEELLTKEAQQREELVKELVSHFVELAKILISNPIEKLGKTPQELIDNYTKQVIEPKYLK